MLAGSWCAAPCARPSMAVLLTRLSAGSRMRLPAMVRTSGMLHGTAVSAAAVAVHHRHTWVWLNLFCQAASSGAVLGSIVPHGKAAAHILSSMWSACLCKCSALPSAAVHCIPNALVCSCQGRGCDATRGRSHCVCAVNTAVHCRALLLCGCWGTCVCISCSVASGYCVDCSLRNRQDMVLAKPSWSCCWCVAA